jgi:hypothetical protein
VSTTAFRALAAQKPQEPERDPTKCAANGCRCRASVNNAGNGWTCFAHAFSEVELWHRITAGVNDHEWLLGLVKDVRRMEREHQDWRGYASQFWHGTDDHCKPLAFENCVPYVNRMLSELLHRIGQSPNRPIPRGPAKRSGKRLSVSI